MLKVADIEVKQTSVANAQELLRGLKNSHCVSQNNMENNQMPHLFDVGDGQSVDYSILLLHNVITSWLVEQ